ncbi:hypothetical protein [Aeromonas hydrophila]
MKSYFLIKPYLKKIARHVPLPLSTKIKNTIESRMFSTPIHTPNVIGAYDYMAEEDIPNSSLFDFARNSKSKGQDIIVFPVIDWDFRLQRPQHLSREGANKRGNSSRLTQSFHFFSLSRSFLP